MIDTTTDIPILTTADDAKAFMDRLAADHDWVSVFWDRGWGDNSQGPDITIITNGNGQDPKARITADVYKALLDTNTIPANSLRTYKARRLHDYREPTPEPRTGPSLTEVAVTAILPTINKLPDVPVFTESGVFESHQIHRNEACKRTVRDQWSVRLHVGFAEVIVSGSGALLFGTTDVIGDTTQINYADYDGGVTGEAFATALTAAIRATYAVVRASAPA